jgi:hypothetical protein
MIYQKLAKIQAAVKGLTKDTKAYSYKYIDGNKCLASIRPLMVEYGLLLMPEVREISTKEVTYKVWNDKAKSLMDKTEVLVTIKMQMTWVDSEDGEMLRQEWAGTGMNDFDKGFGSALTYAERYYLLKFFHIPTDKDDVDFLATTRDAALEQAQGKKGCVFRPLDEESYWKIVRAYVEGRKAKSGNDYRTDYQSITNAGQAEMAKFDHDVENVRLAMCRRKTINP